MNSWKIDRPNLSEDETSRLSALDSYRDRLYDAVAEISRRIVEEQDRAIMQYILSTPELATRPSDILMNDGGVVVVPYMRPEAEYSGDHCHVRVMPKIIPQTFVRFDVAKEFLAFPVGMPVCLLGIGG